MEDEFKPTVQPQRRVNLNIKEVVQKEVVKLLDADLIYPFFDSPWVSLVQVVLKREGWPLLRTRKTSSYLREQLLGGACEFDIEIRDKNGAKNLAADHLSRFENPDLGKLTKAEIRDLFPEEQLMTISDKGSGYHQKDRKPSQNDKTEHGMEKTVQNQGQSPKMSKSESILKNQQSNRSRN
ncbi:hypothetical protein Tco_1145725 [Tanacetum coccineum]